MSPLSRSIGPTAAVLAGASLWIFLAAPRPAGAQFVQYTEPGSLATFEPRQKEIIDRGMAEARWRLGRLRLDPRLELRDIGSYSNVLAESSDGSGGESDLRATAAAGLTGYLGLGSKMRFAAFANGRYDWWQKRDELREFSPSFGAGLFGYFNRLTLTLEGRRSEGEELLGSELEVPYQRRTDSAQLNYAVELGGHLQVYGSATADRIRHSGAIEDAIPGLTLASLDRDVTQAGLGVRRVSSGGWTVGVGAEVSETRFETDRRRDNDGTAGALELTYEGSDFRLELQAQAREIEFPALPELDQSGRITAAGRARWQLGARTATTLYGGRALSYGVFDSTEIVTEDRTGLRVDYQASQRLRLSGFYETGQGEFLQSDGRIDDYRGYGGSLGFDLRPELELTLSYLSDRYDSNVAGFDRDVQRLGLQVRLKRPLSAF